MKYFNTTVISAAAITILLEAGFFYILSATHMTRSTAVIMAHEHTQAVHDAVAALHIPNLEIIDDTDKSSAPGFLSFLFLQTFSVTVALAIFFTVVWLIGCFFRPAPRSNPALQQTGAGGNAPSEFNY